MTVVQRVTSYDRLHRPLNARAIGVQFRVTAGVISS